MELRDEQLISFATIGFFTFSLIHNLANQFTQLQFTVEEARQYLPPETHKQLDQTTQYLSAVLRDSQALLGRNPACPIWFDLQAAILESLELSRFDCFRHKIQVKTRLHHLKVMGNRVAFLQIMLNLLKNSIQATATATTRVIEIQVASRQQKILVKVTDSGQGLPHESALSVQGNTERIQGLGLLYIQQQMQACFQGGFTLENAACGKGCVATLSFPRATKKERAKGRQQPKSPVE